MSSGVAKSGTPGDPMALQLSNTSVGGTGFTCSAAGVIAMNADHARGGPVDSAPNYIGLNIAVKKTVGPVATTEPVGRITAVSTVGQHDGDHDPGHRLPDVGHDHGGQLDQLAVGGDRRT